MMKKISWKGECKDKKNRRIEKKLQKVAVYLGKLSRKEGLTYTSVYMLQSDKKLCSLNTRAMREDFDTDCRQIVCDSFAFVEGIL